MVTKVPDTSRIMRIRAVLKETGLSKTTLWRRVHSGDFPAPLRLGGPGTKAVGWLSTEVADWMDGLSRWEPEGNQES